MRSTTSRFSSRVFKAFALTGASLVAAQTPPPTTTSELQQVVVTAQKRETALQSVPFSVAASSDEQIRNTGSFNIVDLARNIASVAIADLGPGQSQVAIRGISSGQVIRDQPGVKEQVGVYLDESPISVALFTPDLELVDLDRFEVLRGPQGTLFGAGSESGTLRYITRQPQLALYEGSAEVSFMSVMDGDQGGNVRGALNVPIGETLALRVVGYYNHLPGFIDAIQPGGGIDRDVNDGDRSGGRVALLIKPTEALSITPRVVYQKLETNGYPRVDLFNILANPFTTTEPPVTLGSRQQYTQIREGIDDEFALGDLNISYDFGPVALTSISSYTDRDVTVLRDATQLTGSVTFDVGGTDAEVRISSPLYDRTKLEVFSQELRLAGGAEQFQWLVGGFYQDVDRRYGQSLPTAGYDAITQRLFGVVSTDLNAPPNTPYFSDITYTLKQYAFFGEGTWFFNPQWSVTGGLRYYNFEEDRVLNFGGFFSAPTPPEGVPGSVDSDGVSPRVILTYSPTEDLRFNAQFSRGFRLGGINDPINIPLCSPADIAIFGGQSNWRDETAKNYELGAKMQFAQRRVTLNVSAFYSDIKDLQATTTAGTCSSRIVFNVPKSRSRGIEAELFARPNTHWDFGISATYVEAELRSSVVSVTGTTSTVVGGLAEGNRLPTSARFQGVASVGYTQPIGASRDLFVNLTVQHVGSSFSQFENEAPNFGLIAAGGPPGSARLIPFGSPPPSTSFAFNTELPSYELGNLRVGVKQDNFEVAAFVNNLWDEEARLALDYERDRSARLGYLTNMPRTYGVSARWDF